jgi:NADH:ubiquinone oxidoreductase subunit
MCRENQILRKMQILEMIENEILLASTIEGRAELRDMCWVIINHVKENGQLPPEHWRNRLHHGMNIRRSKIDETIAAIDDLARRRYYEKLVSNPLINF